ncbi:MAG: hypothetical protein FJ027_20140 [Candidatus Rokubacteria bacterium]|nr:hypothetical protein [Candidatus Rokubacteria bacterium]
MDRAKALAIGRAVWGFARRRPKVVIQGGLGTVLVLYYVLTQGLKPDAAMAQVTDILRVVMLLFGL